MNTSSPLYDTIVSLLAQAPWRDRRHLSTLAWMVVGLLSSGWIGLSEWVPYVHSRAQFAASTWRRFRRWLANRRVDVHHLYGALLRPVLAELAESRWYVVLDTSLLWNRWCLIRLGLVYRGRTIPLVWKVIDHRSSSVAFRAYRGLLRLAERLLPPGRDIVLLVDRGFMHVELMAWIHRQARWHLRVRIKRSGLHLYVQRRGHYRRLVIRVQAGEVGFYHHVFVGAQRLEMHVAVGWQRGQREPWLILSDEPTDRDTLAEYGQRFRIEENFLDDKSNGFQLESSQLRDARTLTRLLLVLAVATLYLTCQGAAVVAQGQRRRVDTHWFRGHSYLRLGWHWLRYALAHGEALLQRLTLGSLQDPEPAQASRRQGQQKRQQARWMDPLPACYALLLPAREAA